jgi:hypothetical protein
MSPPRRNNLLLGKIEKAVRHIDGANSEGIEMSEVWKTKYGPRRVRRDPPTVAEAVAAARGLTDDPQEQIEIAASLMDLPPDQVRPEVLKAATSRKDVNTVAFVGRAGAPRTVVVERVPSRRPMAGKAVVSKGLTGKRIGR